ncbi:hypothetical protein CQ054_21300 [Ochrobactrum sp. MYb29]|nr:hypothetical protein CQ054_21300 [Ochrobactrum sp. MYb29]
MPLYIKDQAVDDLAEKVRAQLGMRTKTDAVRMALQHELQRSARSKPLRERLAALQEQADTNFCAPVHGTDMKKLMDDLWEDGA